ncbi:MAG: DUF3253 domain-containing protein [Pseudomonadota bacterium]
MKICDSCGRIIEPRKKWAKNWDQVKYCSDRCRKHKHKDLYEEKIIALLVSCSYSKTICPSEVLFESEKKDKSVMEKARSAARRLAAKDKIIILKDGIQVDPSKAKGPIRLKLIRKMI